MIGSMAFACAFISAVFYMAAIFVMKYWGGQSLLLVLPACGGALLLAAVLEIEAMKTAEMARTFIIILALEFVLTLVCAIFLLDERYGVRDLFAVFLVFAGIALLSVRDGRSATSSAARAMVNAPAGKVLAEARLNAPCRASASKGVKKA